MDMHQALDGVAEEALRLAHATAMAWLRGLDDRPVNAVASDQTLRQRIERPMPLERMASCDVVKELAGAVEDGLVGSQSGRFFAWVIGGSLSSALAADWLTSAWGQNAALHATSPASAIVEDVAGRWLKDVLALPPFASFAFVTGCQMAHFTCLAAARLALLASRGWDVERLGLNGSPQIRIICRERQHGSVERAIRYLGLGTDAMHPLPSTDHDVLDEQALEAALTDCGDELAIVILQAGDINTGAFDDFRALIPLAKRHSAWVHIDGAFGAWAAASPRYQHLVAGIGEADSWATDGHKWLNVPFDCGYAIVRDAPSHRAAMSISAPYITSNSNLRDEIDWNPEWSRRARGFSTYAALLELGRAGIARMIERSCDYATMIVDGLERLPGVEVVWRPIVNQGLVRFRDPHPNAGDAEHDHWTETVIQRVVAGGEAYFSPTTWRGKRAMRVSVVNWRTSEHDVMRAIAAVERAIGPPPCDPYKVALD